MNARKFKAISSLTFSICLIACCGVQCASNVITPTPQQSLQKHVSQFHATASRFNLREGDSFNVTCWSESLESLEFICGNLANIYFEKNNTKLESKKWNATSIYYEVQTALAKPLKEFSYECMCRNQTLKTANFMIGLKFKINDFNCRFFDAQEASLNCSFTQSPQIFHIDQNTKYSMKYLNQNISCESNDLSHILCTVPAKCFDQHKFAVEHNFVISMQDQLGNQELEFTRSREELIVLETPGENLEEFNLSSNSLCLRWSNNQKSNHIGYNISWSIELQPLENNFTWTAQQDKSELTESFCLTGLSQAYQKYTLTVRRRYDDSRAHWSAPFVYEFVTAPAIPSRPPIVWPGGYQFKTHTSNSNSSELLVYWQQIQARERNGPQFKYNIQVHNSQLNTQVENLDIQVETNMASIRNLPTSGRYEIIIRSENSVGMSEESSRLMISQEAGSGLDKRIPKFLEVSKEKRQISWQHVEQQENLIGYSVYWCVSNVTDRNRCNDTMAIEMNQVDAQSKYYDTPMDIDDSYEWAVSANYNGTLLSGGMIWRQWTPHAIPDLESAANNSRHGLEGVIALLILAGCLYLLFRKYQYMSNIKVDLPPGVLIGKDEHIELLPSHQQNHHHHHHHQLNSAVEIPNILSANIKPLDLILPTVAAEIYTSPTPPPSPSSVSSISSTSAASLTPFVPVDPRENSNSLDYITMQSLAVVNTNPVNTNPISDYVTATPFYK